METEKPYRNPEFRLLDLQQILPINRTYLSQLINTEYGCNFYQFVTNYRIEDAKRLMTEHPEWKLQDIAEQCGFSSPVVFSRTFTRETGMTPSEWNTRNDNS
jgi:AraC-like DNA-binding protein